jgi:hypothetical protein
MELPCQRQTSPPHHDIFDRQVATADAYTIHQWEYMS